MRAIRPIYDNRISFAEIATIGCLDSLHIRKCLYAIVHQKLQSLGEGEMKKVEKDLKDEEKNWGGRSVWYTDLLAVLYEIKEWADNSNIEIDIIANDNMHEHMKILELFNNYTIEADQEELNERALLYTTPQGFWELLILFEVHWANVILGWELNYSKLVFDTIFFGSFSFGPIRIEVNPAWEWSKEDEKLYQELYDKLGVGINYES